MQITCPHCGFSREVPDDQIPARSELATCPKCKEKFRFRTVAPEEFEFLGAEAPSEGSGPEADTPAGDAAPLGHAQNHAAQDHADPEPRPGGFYGPDAQLHDRPMPGRTVSEGEVTTADEAGIPSVPPPFEDLEHYGFFPGITQSIKRAMLSPRLFFEVMPLRGLGRPLVFALLLFEFYLVVSLFWTFTGLPALSSLLPGATMLDSDVGSGQAQPVVLFVLLPMMFLVNLFLSTGLLHGVLLLLRAAPRGFEATFRATAYAYAPLILSVLPYGYLAGWLWSLPVSIIGCAAIHRVPVWRVILAVCLVAGLVGMVYFSSMQMPHPGGSAQ